MRQEQDDLGTLTLPDDAPYGVRTARVVRHLSVSSRTLADYPALVEALLAVKLAAARANAATGVLTPAVAARIEAAIAKLRQPDAIATADWWPVDALHGGGSIGFNVNINDVIARLAQVDAKREVNASQSTADVCATAFRLALMTVCAPLIVAGQALAAACAAQARALSDVQTLARTCLQDAMPTSLGAFFGGYAKHVARRTERLQVSVNALSAVNLGGTVIGSGDGASDAYRAEVLPALAKIAGVPLTRRDDLYDAAQNSDDVLDLVDAAAAYAEALLKIGRDLRLLASGPDGGFGEIELPAITEGSSFFAGKINPVVPETVMQVAIQVQGLAHAARLAASHRELYLNVFEGQSALNALDALTLLNNATLMLTRDALVGLKPRRDRCADLLSRHQARLSHKDTR